MTEEEIREIAARHQAARYAQAISAAAGLGNGCVPAQVILALESMADRTHIR